MSQYILGRILTVRKPVCGLMRGQRCLVIGQTDSEVLLRDTMRETNKYNVPKTDLNSVFGIFTDYVVIHSKVADKTLHMTLDYFNKTHFEPPYRKYVIRVDPDGIIVTDTLHPKNLSLKFIEQYESTNWLGE